MEAREIRLAPGVSDLAALGARTFEDFFAPVGSGALERAVLLESGAGCERLRVPLPGTPDASGRRHGAPKGAGTGWFELWRWTQAGFNDVWRARFTHPRSTSAGERAWNLVCHLRAHGVNTGEPLAVGRGAGALFAQRSFVALRALDSMRSLADWSRAGLEPRARSRMARALGLALARIFESGTDLPYLRADDVFAGAPRDAGLPDGACVARDLEQIRAGTTSPLRFATLPEIAVCDVRAGRVRGPLTLEQRRRMLRSLARELPALDRRLALRVALASFAPRGDRAGRRAWVASLQPSRPVGLRGAQRADRPECERSE